MDREGRSQPSSYKETELFPEARTKTRAPISALLTLEVLETKLFPRGQD